jgi:hypothetical protein
VNRNNDAQDEEDPMKKRGVGLWLLAAVLMFSLAGPSGLAQKKSSFPKPEELRQTNVCLEMDTLTFTSGMTANAQGEPDGNGLGYEQAPYVASAFIVGSDGTILTNAHVARRLLKAFAVFEDGSRFEINQIKAWDPAHDIAVLKIKGQKAFPAAKLGDSDKVEIMDPIIAVGNTKGEGLQVTDGIINQILADDNRVRTEFKHSANTAGGNSGGAIYRGKEVVAIHFAGRRGDAIMHYAVPINLAKPLLAQNTPWLQLTDVFSPEAIADKLEQIYTKTGVASGAANNTPGGDAVTIPIMNGDDLFIHVQAEQGRHVAVIAANNQDFLGFGNNHPGEDEYLLFSGENMNAVTVGVLNGNAKPCKYAITVYRIVW